MKFFSGFSLSNEQEIFKEYLKGDDFTIAGFSKGAIKAFEYVYSSKERVDRLILISPAFFQDRDEKFKKLQLIYWKKDPNSYIENFLENISYPSSFDMKKYLSIGSYEELKSLLYYVWNEDKLKKLIKKGIKIEVFLGEKDKIIDSLSAREFFKKFATTYYIKGVGHILKAFL